jgi:hypothetical protein
MLVFLNTQYLKLLAVEDEEQPNSDWTENSRGSRGVVAAGPSSYNMRLHDFYLVRIICILMGCIESRHGRLLNGDFCAKSPTACPPSWTKIGDHRGGKSKRRSDARDSGGFSPASELSIHLTSTPSKYAIHLNSTLTYDASLSSFEETPLLNLVPRESRGYGSTLSQSSAGQKKFERSAPLSKFKQLQIFTCAAPWFLKNSEEFIVNFACAILSWWVRSRTGLLTVSGDRLVRFHGSLFLVAAS